MPGVPALSASPGAPSRGGPGVDQVSRVERSTTWSTPGPRRARAPADAIQGGRVARVGTSAAESRNGGPVGAFPIFDVQPERPREPEVLEAPRAFAFLGLLQPRSGGVTRDPPGSRARRPAPGIAGGGLQRGHSRRASVAEQSMRGEHQSRPLSRAKPAHVRKRLVLAHLPSGNAQFDVCIREPFVRCY